MSDITDVSQSPPPVDSVKAISLVSLAHLYSHFVFFVLPPLFPLLRDDLSVSYTQFGVLLVVFNLVTGLTQMPMGIVVDRLDAPKLLTGAVALQGVAFIGIGLAPSYWMMIAMMIPAGLANAVYHPADYTILNRSVAPTMMGRAFSIHTVSGFGGGAIAPLTMVGLAAITGWQSAIVYVGVAGVLIALILMVNQDALLDKSSQSADSEDDGEESNRSLKSTLSLLMSLPILIGFVFWLFISVANKGVSYFSVSAFDQMYGMPLASANLSLTAFLTASSIGILIGGVLGDRSTRHDLIVISGTLVAGIAILVLGIIDMGVFGIVMTMTIAGLSSGVTTPSRDLLVRSVTPKNAVGAVFGFVSTGLNVGGVIVPVIFGWLLDIQAAMWVFVISGVFQIAIILTVFGMKAASQKEASPA